MAKSLIKKAVAFFLCLFVRKHGHHFAVYDFNGQFKVVGKTERFAQA